MQAAIVNLIFYAIQENGNAVYAIANNQVPNLLAQQQMYAGSAQLPLPSDQWTLEVEDWHTTVMAMLQRSVVDFATGPSNTSWQQYIETPERNTTVAELCQLVRARTNGEYRYVFYRGSTK